MLLQGPLYQMNRNGWSMFGRCLGLVNNKTSHADWQLYFDSERVWPDGVTPGEQSAVQKNHMTIETFFQAISKVAGLCVAISCLLFAFAHLVCL
jgi:hypothetical protein